MEKISKIIPPNRRTQPDIIPAQSNKPGVFQSRKALESTLDKAVMNPQLDGFDFEKDRTKDVGEIPVKGGFEPIDKVTLSEAPKVSNPVVEKQIKPTEQGYEKMKEAQRAQMVERISQKFFAPQSKAVNRAPEVVEASQPKSEEVANQVERNQKMKSPATN